MYGRLGYLHLVHLAEANARRNRLKSHAGEPATPGSRSAHHDAGVFLRLAIVLGFALASAWHLAR